MAISQGIEQPKPQSIIISTKSEPVSPVVQQLVPDIGPQPAYKTGWRPAMGWTALATPLVDIAMQFVGVGAMDKITLVCTTVLGIATVIMRGIERIKGRA